MIVTPAVLNLIRTLGGGAAPARAGRLSAARDRVLAGRQPSRTRFGTAFCLCLSLLVIPGVVSAAEEEATVSPEVFTNADCLDCHTDPTLSRTVNGLDVLLELVQTNALEKSVHAKLSCVDCHTGITDLVHESNLPPAQCVTCHEPQPNHAEALADYADSVHGRSRAAGASAAPNCADCQDRKSVV